MSRSPARAARSSLRHGDHPRYELLGPAAGYSSQGPKLCVVQISLERPRGRRACRGPQGPRSWRLIYVIPFTSVVEQTADVYRRVLSDAAVLEHRSAFDWDGLDESEAEQRRIAGASWDAPIVVAVAVQIFESLYAAREKRCRKLHNLARSVVVIDEAQTMPRAFLRPYLAALRELMAGYGAWCCRLPHSRR